MGTGYTLRCKKCAYKISANLGVGFFFPKVYQQTMEAAREGKFGETIRQFLQNHPDGALNIESVFLQCPECGSLKNGPDLSMYVRNQEIPRRENGRWSVAAPFEDADYVSPMELEQENTYVLYAPGHICKKCGKPLKSITENELVKRDAGEVQERGRTVISCPKCGNSLWIDDVIMWD